MERVGPNVRSKPKFTGVQPLLPGAVQSKNKGVVRADRARKRQEAEERNNAYQARLASG